ncbi:MAG: substrate-binding domain-containing protein [Gemmataceae bacterium]
MRAQTCPGRGGRLHLAWLVFLASIGVAGLVVAALVVDTPGILPGSTTAPRPLMVFCAAGLRIPVEAAARRYQEEYGTEIQLQYGGSNTLLASLEVADRADLFIPADDSYTRTARERGLVAEVVPLASMRPVLVVREGNPRQIRSLDDLLSRDLRIGQANPEAAAIGKLVADTLKPTERWAQFQKRVAVTKPTVTDVATDVQLGAIDAAMVWDVTLKAIPGLERVPAPVFDQVQASLSVCVAARTAQPTAALRFARFLAARDQGLRDFETAGFEVVAGDRWSAAPQLRLLAGAMLRPAIEETLTRFEQREGVQITRVYNGCGILVAQMRTGGATPDAFFACDADFMKQVHDLFAEPATLSSNQLVLLVARGNPHGIRRLRDLAKPGLRVGIGHEKQCAMGVLTQQTLREDRSHDVVMKNVKVQSPTGDMLVNQMLTGSLDAVIAYISNAAGHADQLEAIPIDIPCAIADQPFARGRSTEYPYLLGRLLDALRSHESRERFEAFGFRWKGAAPR